MFDDGYDAYHSWVLARMIDPGGFAAGHEAHPDQPVAPQANPGADVRPRNTLNADERKLFPHTAEVWAGLPEYTSAGWPRAIP